MLTCAAHPPAPAGAPPAAHAGPCLACCRRARSLKERGDEELHAGNLRSAWQLYSQALTLLHPPPAGTESAAGVLALAATCPTPAGALGSAPGGGGELARALLSNRCLAYVRAGR